MLAQITCLNNLRTIFVLAAIRWIRSEKRRCNYISVYILLAKQKRTIRKPLINTLLSNLIAAGYITKAKSSALDITLPGLQALSDFNKQLATGYYLYSKKEATKPKTDKRPKI